MAKRKRNFLSWLFFQDPKDEQKGDHSQSKSTDGTVMDKWVQLHVNANGAQTLMTMQSFPFCIGRAVSPGGITLDEPSLSSRHAIIDFQNGVITITDINSKNGTSIGERQLVPGQPAPVSQGETIKMGRVEIVLVGHSESHYATTSQTEVIRTDGGFEGTEILSDEVLYTPPPSPQPSPETTAPPTQTTQSPKRFCNKCGTKNLKLANFCAKCGKNLV